MIRRSLLLSAAAVLTLAACGPGADKKAGGEGAPLLVGATAVENLAGAIAATTAVVTQARRHLRIYSRDLDPGLLDSATVLGALRRFSTRNSGGEVRILLQDAAADAARRAGAPRCGQRAPATMRTCP